VPLWIAGFGYWVLGIGGGSLLAFHFNFQGAGLWWGLALGLMTTSCLLCVRFNILTRYKIGQLPTLDQVGSPR
jgi:MATE family multidrug resistance protein